MRIIEINREEFLSWRFSQYDDLRGLGEEVLERLIEMGCFTITAEQVFKSTGYIPFKFIKNMNEVAILLSQDEIMENELTPNTEDFIIFE